MNLKQIGTLAGMVLTAFMTAVSLLGVIDGLVEALLLVAAIISAAVYWVLYRRHKRYKQLQQLEDAQV